VPAPANPNASTPPRSAPTTKIYFASSNAGKLAEFRALAETQSPNTPSPSTSIELELVPDFNSLPQFPEDAPTFAENALGKALYYSQLTTELVFADDSGLVVPALNGEPGVHSARYAGPTATSEQRNAKLLSELAKLSAASLADRVTQPQTADDRSAFFCCVIAIVKNRRPLAIISNRADGIILESPRGTAGFGYDPIFLIPALNKSFAELTRQEKNQYSHRGKAFRRLLATLPTLL
jgi:XTP/dITP diphosphohydrolase